MLVGGAQRDDHGGEGGYGGEEEEEGCGVEAIYENWDGELGLKKPSHGYRERQELYACAKVVAAVSAFNEGRIIIGGGYIYFGCQKCEKTIPPWYITDIALSTIRHKNIFECTVLHFVH